MYLSEKNSSLDEEISKYAEQLYSRVAPQTVRGFIEMTAKQQVTEKRKLLMPNLPISRDRFSNGCGDPCAALAQG